MKKILFAVAAMTFLTAALASQALAGSKDNHNQSHPVVHHVPVNSSMQVAKTNFAVTKTNPGKVVNFNKTFGKKFAQETFYPGKNHSHWTSHRWDRRYGCEVYFDPNCTCWYYWCEPDACYYPVTYCPYRIYSWTPAAVQPMTVQAPATQYASVPQTQDDVPPIPDPTVPQSNP